MAEIQIRPPISTEPNDPAFVQHVVDLINKAYRSTELALYKPIETRTNCAEIKRLLQARQLHLAFTTNNPLPIGCVHTHVIEQGVSDVGLLAVPSEARSLGLGRRLVAYAEGVAVRQGSKVARLEMAVPKAAVKHDFEEYLQRWYEKLGYEQVRRASVEEVVPHLKESFGEGLEFLVMEKKLQSNEAH